MMKANSNTGFKTLAPWGIFYCTPGERTNPLRAITKASRCVASKQISIREAQHKNARLPFVRLPTPFF
jgi:hypothetical protein